MTFTLVLLLTILALLLAALGIAKPVFCAVSIIILSVAVILLATGTNPKLW